MAPWRINELHVYVASNICKNFDVSSVKNDITFAHLNGIKTHFALFTSKVVFCTLARTPPFGRKITI